MQKDNSILYFYSFVVVEVVVDKNKANTRTRLVKLFPFSFFFLETQSFTSHTESKSKILKGSTKSKPDLQGR